jgi:hypothetical protein
MKPVYLLLAAALSFPGAAAAHGALADISLYDRTEGRHLPVYWHEGRAYVAGKPGNEYQISLRNRGREEILAVVSVDGVNAITGQSAEPSQSGYVLSPHGRLDILGWRRSLSQTAAFYFTSLGDSYAARTGRSDDVGVIGVALFRKKPPLPAGPIARDRGAAAESAKPAERQLGTGHGRREASYAYHVEFERASTAPAEIITLYYDSRANLLARGIIRETITHPRPFPGFVPDPPG